MDPNNILLLVLALPALISSLTLHEFAHAWTAYKLGDDTAKLLGRVNLDPLVHLDVVGTGILVVAILLGWPVLGWAKPVPVNPNNLKNRRRDDVLISIAGPISNLIQAAVWLMLLVLLLTGFKLIGHSMSEAIMRDVLDPHRLLHSWRATLVTAVSYGVIINISLAAFNLIPLPPLDGHWVLMGLEIPSINRAFEIIRPWSFTILMVLVILPPFSNYFDIYMGWFLDISLRSIIYTMHLFV